MLMYMENILHSMNSPQNRLTEILKWQHLTYL